MRWSWLGLVERRHQLTLLSVEVALVGVEVVPPFPLALEDPLEPAPGEGLVRDEPQGLATVGYQAEPEFDHQVEGVGILEGAAQNPFRLPAMGGGEALPVLDIGDGQVLCRFDVFRRQGGGALEGEFPGVEVGHRNAAIVARLEQIDRGAQQHRWLPGDWLPGDGVGGEQANFLERSHRPFPGGDALVFVHVEQPDGVEEVGNQRAGGANAGLHGVVGTAHPGGQVRERILDLGSIEKRGKTILLAGPGSILED